MADDRYYSVERIIAKKNEENTAFYLLKWEEYSLNASTWECENNLTPLLLRSYGCPQVPQARLQENLDRLLVAISTKLKGKSRSPAILEFHSDCYRLLFDGKGEGHPDGKSRLLSKECFEACNFHETWDQCLDKNGDGVIIKYPIKLKSFLSWSPKIYATLNNNVIISPRTPIEKLSVDFVRQPYSIVNT